MGGISVRGYIRWLPDEASEPTSTMVVTGANHHFVDIRVLKPEGEKGPWPVDLEKVSLDRVEWLIAGTSSYWNVEGEDFTHGRWEHWIDSRTTDTAGAADEGINFAQPDGSTLEKGTMENPATGKDTEYEELWHAPEPRPTPAGPVRSLVLKLDRDGGRVRGLVVRLGQYCQGFLRRGRELAAERWEWTEAAGWRRMISVGDESALPCSLVLGEDASYHEGDSIKVGDDDWKAIEAIGF